MQLVRTILFWLLVLLSLATGGVKLFNFEQDQRVFAALGFSHTMTWIFGLVQVIGGLLLIWPQTRNIGAVVMILSFIVATIALFAAGDTSFGFFSILFIILAALPCCLKRVGDPWPKAKADNPTVADYLDQLDSPHKDLLLQVRQLILDTDEGISEDIKWRDSLVFIYNKNMIQTVMGKEHITFIFFDGVDLDDPAGLLEGDGKKNRSVRVSDWAALDQAAFRKLVEGAVAQRLK